MADEGLTAPEKYGVDRLFIYLRLDGDENHTLDRHVAALKPMAIRCARIDLMTDSILARNFFAGSLPLPAPARFSVFNPFNQPDVQLAKDLAKKAMSGTGGNKRAASFKEEVSAGDPESLSTAVSIMAQ